MTRLQIIAHRGQWKNIGEKNTEIAFRRALGSGFGIETDVRNRDETLVISHDPPIGDELSLEAFLQIYARSRHRPTLALNIKAAGLANRLSAELRTVGTCAAFVFDMSIPDTLDYLDAGLPVFTRQSEYEPIPALYDRAAGVWLDAFEREWYSVADIKAHLRREKKVCLVSPEIHGRPHRPAWIRLREAGLHDDANFMICTDLLREAQAFFEIS